MRKSRNPYTLTGIALLSLSSVLLAVLTLLYFSESFAEDSDVESDIAVELSTPPINEERPKERLKTVAISDGGEMISIETSAATVGMALYEAGIPIYMIDDVQPPPGDWIDDGEQITIDRANKYSVLVDGKTIDIYSHFTRTIDIINQAGVGLIGLDTTNPAPEETMKPGDRAEVIRITEVITIHEEEIPFQVLWQGTDELEIDQKAQLNPGKNGLSVKETRIRLENNQEVGQETGEWISQEPVNEVIGYGTRPVIRTISTPEGPLEYWRVVKMRVTAYTPASAGKPADHPGYGITASGVQAGKGVVAIDPRIVPFRSSVYVPGYGVGFAGDTGGGVKGRFIDLGFDDGQIEAWRGYVDVYYLTPVPDPENINYLLPETLP